MSVQSATFADIHLSEEDIKSRYIQPALEDKGWDKYHMRLEYAYTAGQIIVQGSLKHRKRGKRVDYLPAVKFIPNTRYDFQEYFKDVIGVTVASEGQEVEEILIEVDGQQYPYVSSKPMHPSQHLVRYTDEGNAIIMLKVIDNFELRQMILSYGKRMTVISPEHLKTEIREELQEILKKYQSTQID